MYTVTWLVWEDTYEYYIFYLLDVAVSKICVIVIKSISYVRVENIFQKAFC